MRQFFKTGERLGAYVMLHAFGIDGGGARVDPQRQQELEDDAVAAARFGGQFRALGGQHDRAVTLGADQARLVQPSQDAVDGHVADGEPPSQVDDTATAFFIHGIRNGFDIIFRRLGRVIAPCAAMGIRTAGRLGHRFLPVQGPNCNGLTGGGQEVQWATKCSRYYKSGVGMIRVVMGMMLLGVAACNGPSSGAGSTSEERSQAFRFRGEPPIQAVATVGMVADALREVGGPRVEVTQIMGSGVDPHMYKMTRDDVQVILDADILFCVGLMLEGKMLDALARIGRSQPLVVVGERMGASRVLRSSENANAYDPHVWMDVGLWAEAVRVVVAALSEFDSAGATEYEARAADYLDELERLDEYALRALGSIPPEHRILITSHDAFHYLGRAYGMEVRGIQGLSTESEAGLQRINELVDLIVDRRVPAVFVESSVSPRNIRALVEGARSRGHSLRIGGELFSDAMGELGTYEGTYVGMLDHNITTVARALGGEAPRAGLHGRLASGE